MAEGTIQISDDPPAWEKKAHRRSQNRTRHQPEYLGGKQPEGPAKEDGGSLDQATERPQTGPMEPLTDNTTLLFSCHDLLIGSPAR